MKVSLLITTLSQVAMTSGDNMVQVVQYKNVYKILEITCIDRTNMRGVVCKTLVCNVKSNHCQKNCYPAFHCWTLTSAVVYMIFIPCFKGVGNWSWPYTLLS